MGNIIIKTTLNKKESISKNYLNIPEKDFNLLKTIGFKIEELIGSGEVGSVYRGVYEPTATGIRDSEGRLLDVVIGQQFALKYIDIKQREELELRKGIERMERIRSSIQREKQIQRKLLLDSNLLHIKVCFNLGKYQTICLNSSPLKLIPLEEIEVQSSYDRLYLLMDFSKLGNLDKYLLELSSKGLTVNQIEANIWCKRLLSALKYLHEFNVFNINIKPKNILMFEEFIESMGQTSYVVPKLSDFWVYHNFKDQIEDKDNECHENSSEEESFDSKIQFSSKELSKMSDIYLLSEIFDKIIRKTEFESESNRELALNLIESMKDYSHKRCDNYIENKWFESKELNEN